MDGAGSSLNIASEITVGVSGSGTLAITNSATASFPNATHGVNGAVIIGRLSGSNGAVTVDGAGSHLQAGDISVGYNTGATGSLTVSDGATVDTTKLRLGGMESNVEGGSGSLTVTGTGSVVTHLAVILRTLVAIKMESALC